MKICNYIITYMYMSPEYVIRGFVLINISYISYINKKIWKSDIIFDTLL